MPPISISQLKMRPSEAIREAADFPVAIQRRNKTTAYLIGKDLYEKIVSYIENFIDRRAVVQTDFKKGRRFEEVAEELGI